MCIFHAKVPPLLENFLAHAITQCFCHAYLYLWRGSYVYRLVVISNIKIFILRQKTFSKRFLVAYHPCSETAVFLELPRPPYLGTVVVSRCNSYSPHSTYLRRGDDFYVYYLRGFFTMTLTLFSLGFLNILFHVLAVAPPGERNYFNGRN